MYLKRFEDVLLNMRDDASCSLPVCNQTEEVLFFYHTKADPQGKYCVDKVLGVFSRNIVTGTIAELPTDSISVLTASEKPSVPTISPMEALNYRNQYIGLYETYFNSIKDGVLVPNSLRQLLLASFEKCVQDAALLHIYNVLGKDFFSNLYSSDN